MPMNAWIIISIAELITIVMIAAVLLVKNHKRPSKKSVELKPIKVQANWPESLHDRFCKQWISQFSEISYPINAEDKARMLALIWNIASISIDCLMVCSDDANLLQRHRDSVLFLTGESERWGNLKVFHRDPSTVPYQVIAVYDVLKESGYKGGVVAFGYQLIID